MANKDSTGPKGQGSKTGKGKGNCTNNSSSNKNQSFFERLNKSFGWGKNSTKKGFGNGRGANRQQNKNS